jgi:diacylglycerol kinase family enzyme
LTPSARFDDGLLDVCLVESIPVPRIVRYVPAVLRGTHGSLPICHMARGEGASITVDPGLYVHADGEIVAARARRVDVRLLPKRLSVICP